MLPLGSAEPNAITDRIPLTTKPLEPHEIPLPPSPSVTITLSDVEQPAGMGLISDAQVSQREAAQIDDITLLELRVSKILGLIYLTEVALEDHAQSIENFRQVY